MKLLEARQRSGYWGQVHWRELKEGTGQDKASDVARDFLLAFLSSLDVARFKAFIVDHNSPHRFFFPYPGDPQFGHHIAEGLDAVYLGALAWLFGGLARAQMRFVFDQSSGEWKRAQEKLPEELHVEVNTRHAERPHIYPTFDIVTPPWWCFSNPRSFTEGRTPSEGDFVNGTVPVECDLLQMTDVILGGILLALRPGKLIRSQDGKVRLATKLREFLADTIPGITEVRRINRRFSVSIFPDKNLRAYAAAQYIERADSQVQLPLLVAPRKREIAVSRAEALLS